MKDATVQVHAAFFCLFGVLSCAVTHNVVGQEPSSAGGFSNQDGTATSNARASGGAWSMSSATASGGAWSMSSATASGGAWSMSSATASAGAWSGSTLKFLWIPKEKVENNPVFQLGQKGAEAKARELTESSGTSVQVVYAPPASAEDVEGQAEIVRSAIGKHVNGVAVSCNSEDDSELIKAIHEVSDEGIPVMTFDSDSPNSDRFTYLGGDNEAAGALAAKILGTAMGASAERKKVALVSGVTGAANLDARIDGFLETINADFPNLVPLNDIAYSNDDGPTAATLIEGLMRDHAADLGGIFFVGPWPLYVCSGTDCSQRMPLWSDAATAGDVKTVVFDTLASELAFVENEMVVGLVGQRYWGWGSESVQMLYDRAVNQKRFLSWTDSGIDVVCKNNVKEMEDMWKFERLEPQLSDCVINGVTIKQ